MSREKVELELAKKLKALWSHPRTTAARKWLIEYFTGDENRKPMPRIMWVFPLICFLLLPPYLKTVWAGLGIIILKEIVWWYASKYL